MKILLIALLLNSMPLIAADTTATDSPAAQPTITVYKSPTCGCCGHWIEHVEKAGFMPTGQNTQSVDYIKDKYGVPVKARSCHTGVTNNGYFFEGHVPAASMKRFLEKPLENATGLAVPGMPMGSPGMEMGDHFTPYQVLLVYKDGSTSVFEDITSKKQRYQ